jgi:hypothetical protein
MSSLDSPGPATPAGAVGVLLPSTEEELLARLGALALGESLGFGPADIGRHVRVGRRWLETQADSLRDLLCLSPAVLAAREIAAGDDAVLATAIADVLLGVYGLPTAATAALLITRRGLDNLCS